MLMGLPEANALAVDQEIKDAHTFLGNAQELTIHQKVTQPIVSNAINTPAKKYFVLIKDIEAITK